MSIFKPAGSANPSGSRPGQVTYTPPGPSNPSPEAPELPDQGARPATSDADLQKLSKGENLPKLDGGE